MFHLTPQERSVVLGLCLIVFSGTLINIGLQKNLRLFNWLHTAQKGSLLKPVDINRASVEEFLRIPGIGPKTAQFIISYRNQHKKIQDLDFLKQARGMTPERYERIIQYLKI